MLSREDFKQWLDDERTSYFIGLLKNEIERKVKAMIQVDGVSAEDVAMSFKYVKGELSGMSYLVDGRFEQDIFTEWEGE